MEVWSDHPVCAVLALIQILFVREIAFLVVLVVEIACRWLVDLHGGVPHDSGGRLFKASFLIIGLEHASYCLRISKVLIAVNNNMWRSTQV